jgi:ornithine carbamoyltransferase
MSKRDFLTLSDLSLKEHQALIARARALKAARQRHEVVKTLEGRTLAMVFEKPSTRTRLSFEAAIQQLAGGAVVLTSSESQLGRGETIADTARVMSRYVDCIMFRTFADERLREMAQHATVPVINGLSDGAHPVQLLADLQTVEERLGSYAGKTMTFVGDGSSNMARSWMEAARHFGFQLRLGAPEGYRPPAPELAACAQHVTVFADPLEAVKGADVVITDTWTSMGQEAESALRLKAFQGFRVDDAMVQQAASHAIVLHCLPAHRDEEITSSVLDGPRSAVWDEAENRMHAQKALLEMLILGKV